MQSKRILLKLSGETLKGNLSNGSYDFEFMDALAKKIIKLKNSGYEIVIVLGAGNIFRGQVAVEGGLGRTTGDYMGMLGTVMNGMAVGNTLEKNGASVRVMTAIEIPRVAETFIRKRATKHLQKGRIVIATAGTGNPYFTTDSAAVLRALELDCEYMVKGTKVDGVYDKDPNKYPNAKKYEKISLQEANRNRLNIMDHSALAMAMDNKLPIIVCKIDDIDNLKSDGFVHTYVYPEG